MWMPCIMFADIALDFWWKWEGIYCWKALILDIEELWISRYLIVLIRENNSLGTVYLQKILQTCVTVQGDTPIHKLYGDVPPFRVWFYDCPLINKVSNSNIFEDFFYKQDLKIMNFDKKWVEFDLKIISYRVSIFHDFHKLFIIFNKVRVSRSGWHLPT